MSTVLHASFQNRPCTWSLPTQTRDFTYEFWSHVFVVQVANYFGLNEQYCFNRWNTVHKMFDVWLSLEPIFNLYGVKLAYVFYSNL